MSANLHGLEFPDGLFYAPDYNLWLREEVDGSLTLGLSAYGCALYGEIFAFTPSATAGTSNATAASAWSSSPNLLGPQPVGRDPAGEQPGGGQAPGADQPGLLRRGLDGAAATGRLGLGAGAFLQETRRGRHSPSACAWMGSIRSIQGCRRWTSETPGFYPHSARGGRITPLALFALPSSPSPPISRISPEPAMPHPNRPASTANAGATPTTTASRCCPPTPPGHNASPPKPRPSARHWRCPGWASSMSAAPRCPGSTPSRSSTSSCCRRPATIRSGW